MNTEVRKVVVRPKRVQHKLPAERRAFYNKLIAQLEQNPIIYDRDHEDYKNCPEKERHWQIIAKEVGQSVNECKKAYRSLRVQYVLFSKRAPSYRKTWIHYESLRFLDKYIAKSLEISQLRQSRGGIPKTFRPRRCPTKVKKYVQPPGHSESEQEDHNAVLIPTISMKEEKDLEIVDNCSVFLSNSDIQEDVSSASWMQNDSEMSGGIFPDNATDEDFVSPVSPPSSHTQFSVHHHEPSSSGRVATFVPHTNPSWKPFMEMIASQLPNIPEERIFDFQIDILRLFNEKIKEYRN